MNGVHLVPLQRAQNKALSMYFQQKYAAVVLELERLNKDLNEYLCGAQAFAHEVGAYINQVSL